MFPSYKHLLDLYFEQANGKQIIAHQIESFNHFMDVEIPTIIKQVNPVIIRGSPEIPLSGPRSALASATGLSTSAANALLGKEAIAFNIGGAKHEYEVCIEFENPQIRKPTIFENNGSIQPMMPNDARLRNFTYASPLCVDIRVKTTFIDNTRGSIRETKQRIFPNVHLGKIPVMVGSKYCLLHEQSHLESRLIGECAEDIGGYFIIQGGERVIISQERMSENRPFIFRNNRNPIKDVEIVEIKCIGPKNEQVPKSNAVKIMYHPKNPQIHLLRVQIPRVKTEIPLFIIFRALGILADKDIIELILGQEGDSSYDDIIQESIEEAGFIITQEQALVYLAEQATNSTSKAQRHIRVEDLLAEELFPHIGKTGVAYEKACFLAHMTRKVLWISSRRIQPDDRDGYPNKRVDLPGFLLANLVRSYFSMKMVKDMKAAIAKEIHSGSWRANGNYEDILNISNIYKVVKSTILEVGLKSSLATGNFGNAKLGGPSKIGVSQVLNRLNYISGISHLRRVSTPIEKTGKLVPPRKLNNTQWGFICPSETPEGHSVGVVKNMSSVANVSIYSNPGNVRDFIERTGLCKSLRDSNIEEKTIGARIFLNGVWLGTVEPEKTMGLVNSLRKAKRCGQIHIHTGIVWKSSLKELWISVESGRILRPILYAPAIREIAADTSGGLCKQIDEITDWEGILLWQTPSGKNLIEYIDSGESEGAYIAMTPEKALEDISTTHCEIHPSTILGTIASNIPFPDHNQSPRNSYQCLWVGEKVRMANGTEKRICDVEIGDEVITIDRDTHESSISRVCYHYVRSTDKKIYKVNISGDRHIIATEDHCFMTDHGPIRADELDYTKHQMAIHIGPEPVLITVERKLILDEATLILRGSEAGIHKSMLESHIETLKEIRLLPLYSDDWRVPILARICGLACTDGSLNVYIKTKTVANKTYTYSLPQFQAHFGGILSANIFEKDMATLKLPEVSVRESLRVLDGRQRHTWFVQHNGPLPTILIALGASFGKKTETARLSVPEWIINGSLMTKREFLGGFQGGDGCRISIRKSGQWVNAYCEQTSQQAKPEIADNLRDYMMQIIKLFADFDISVHMREDEEVSDSRTRLRYKMENGVKTLMKFWKSIGYRYDEHKNSASAIVMEFLKAHSLEEKIPYTKWTEWLTKVRCLGETIFIPLNSVESHENVNISDITVFNDNHTFVTTNSTIVGNCAMGKQAMGVYALNYRERYDAMSHVLCYPNVPLVSPFMSKFYGLQTMPSGENIIVAIMTYSGYNQEDSIMINRASLERGRFRSIFYRTYKDEEKKNQSSGEEERFDCPDASLTRQMKHANYGKLGLDGLIPENTYVDSDDILIGKVVPLRVPTGMVLPAGTKRFRDVSRMPRNNEWGYIDKIFKNRNGEGYSFVKIRVRQDRMPEIGDKFCLTPDHDVLTKERGWVPIIDVTTEDKVAQLNRETGNMEYVTPLETLDFEHTGKMYEVETQGVSLHTTLNHRMWVQKRDSDKYELITAENIMGKRVRFQCDGPIVGTDIAIDILDHHFTGEYADAFLRFVGIWFAEGWTQINEKNYIKRIEIAANKPRVQHALMEDLMTLGWNCSFRDINKKLYINEKDITEYLSEYSVGAINKSLPSWVWNLSARQCRILLAGLLLGDGHETAISCHYFTSSVKLRDDVQRLAQHCGWTAYYVKRSGPGNTAQLKDGRTITSTVDSWTVQIRKTRLRPTLNHGHSKTQNGQKEIITDYDGKVYCLRVPSEVFLVRRNGRCVWTGNSSRHGQKGTCGMILDPQDMPQSASGIIPDIIINPHCIPSRMTIAQLMETLLGRICCEAGGIGDGSPFNGITLEWMAELLRDKYKLEPYSNEILYNGYTGRQMETKIFMGPCFYQRLRHCSADKMHSRASGPLVMLTRQPAEGRAREGGLRFGEMERDAVLAHGIAEFTKERLMECSDGFRCWICRECGLIAVANQREGIWKCMSCGNRTGFANVQIPYAYKLLLQELETMNITSRILTQGKFLQIKDRAGQCN